LGAVTERESRDCSVRGKGGRKRWFKEGRDDRIRDIISAAEEKRRLLAQCLQHVFRSVYHLNWTSPGEFRRLEPSSCDLTDDNHHITTSMRELAGWQSGRR